MTRDDALAIIIAAARAHAQSIADDADKSRDEEAEEAELWEALECVEGST